MGEKGNLLLQRSVKTGVENLIGAVKQVKGEHDHVSSFFVSLRFCARQSFIFWLRLCRATESADEKSEDDLHFSSARRCPQEKYPPGDFDIFWRKC
jgi:hypothetical protein